MSKQNGTPRSDLARRILDAQDLPIERGYRIDRWDAVVDLIGVPVGSTEYRDYIYRRVKGQVPTEEEAGARRIVMAVVMGVLDPATGDRLFTIDDAEALREKHWQTMVTVATKVLELAGLEDDIVGGLEMGKASSGTTRGSGPSTG